MARKRKRGRQQPTLDGVHIKLARAQLHIEALDAELAQVFPNGTYAVAPEIRDDGRKHVYRADSPPTFDARVSAIIGDALHNLRSSLDHIVHQLVSRPTIRTQFPILDRPQRRRFTKKVTLPRISGGAGLNLRQVVDSVQPYNRRHLNHNLGVLRDLNNIDKHRTLLVTAGAIGGHITSGLGEPPKTTTTFTGHPLEHGQILAIVIYEVPQEYPDPNLKFIPFIAFGRETPHVRGHSVIGTLQDLRYHIAYDVIPPLSDFF